MQAKTWNGMDSLLSPWYYIVAPSKWDVFFKENRSNDVIVNHITYSFEQINHKQLNRSEIGSVVCDLAI